MRRSNVEVDKKRKEESVCVCARSWMMGRICPLRKRRKEWGKRCRLPGRSFSQGKVKSRQEFQTRPAEGRRRRKRRGERSWTVDVSKEKKTVTDAFSLPPSLESSPPGEPEGPRREERRNFSLFPAFLSWIEEVFFAAASFQSRSILAKGSRYSIENKHYFICHL